MYLFTPLRENLLPEIFDQTGRLFYVTCERAVRSKDKAQIKILLFDQNYNKLQILHQGCLIIESY